MPLAFKPIATQQRFAKILLIGEAGVGKTHAALTFPKPAVIDAEGSIDWFSDRFTFIAVPTKSYADVRDLTAQVRNGKVECETLIIDSLTSIYNGLVNAATQDRLKQGSDDLRPLDWGRIKRKFSSLLDELYHQLRVNIVCVGWIKAEYAKPGDNVNGKTVQANDLVKIGEIFDGDKKTMYAFDFVIKIVGNDGKKTRAQVLKSRSSGLKAGQMIDDFSWKTIEGLLPKGETTYEGMTDETQEMVDGSLFDNEGAAPSAPAPKPGRARAPQPNLIDRRKKLLGDVHALLKERGIARAEYLCELEAVFPEKFREPAWPQGKEPSSAVLAEEDLQKLIGHLSAIPSKATA